jgi:hypothetical protein
VNPEGHLAATAASGQPLTKNQKKKLKRKMKKVGAASDLQQAEDSETTSEGPAGSTSCQSSETGTLQLMTPDHLLGAFGKMSPIFRKILRHGHH